MHKLTQIMREKILKLLASELSGLEVKEIIDCLDTEVSVRSIRNLINQLTEEGKLVKERKKNHKGKGTPPYIYSHKSEINSNKKSSRSIQDFILDHWHIRTCETFQFMLRNGHNVEELKKLIESLNVPFKTQEDMLKCLNHVIKSLLVEIKDLDSHRDCLKPVDYQKLSAKTKLPIPLLKYFGISLQQQRLEH